MMRLFAITTFAMLFGGLMAMPVAAQDAKPLDVAATAQIKSEVLDAVAGYLKIWNARDPEGVAANVYAVPSFVVLPGGVVSILHREDVAKRYGDIMKQLLSMGWDRSSFDVASVCVLNANTALVSGKSTRYRTDGSIMGILAETFVYVRTNAGWRIEGLIVQQPNKVVTCNE